MKKFGYLLYPPDGSFLKEESEYLMKNGCQEVYADPYRTNSEYPNFEKILSIIEEGDAIVVRNLACLATSTKHLIPILNTLVENRLHLISLEQKSINTTSFGSNDIYQLMGLFNSLYRQTVSVKAVEVIADAQSLGLPHGRPEGLSEENYKKALKVIELRNQGILVTDVLKRVGISRKTYYNYLERWRNGTLNPSCIRKKS